MVPILLCSVLALAIFFERLLYFARLPRQEERMADAVPDLLRAGEWGRAMSRVAERDSPLGRVYLQALEVIDQDRETMETVIVHAIDEEVRGSARHLQPLATIGTIAPLLGLLGTVLGMIRAFMLIQRHGGEVDASLLAGGIWEAMLTTALGLMVALPVMVAQAYLRTRVERHEASMRRAMVRFIKAIAWRAHGDAS